MGNELGFHRHHGYILPIIIPRIAWTAVITARRVGIMLITPPVIISTIIPAWIIGGIIRVGGSNHCALESISTVINPEGATTKDDQ
jgi:hypothetical protein